MTDRIIHFVHANGFPAETYRKLFECLSPEFIVQYKSMHGHEKRYPVKNNWRSLVQELTDYLEDHYQKPIIGVGHSFGGILILLAAIEKPHLFESIVLLDSSILNRVHSYAVRLAKRFGWIDHLTGGRASRLRRTHWRNHEEAVEYFRRRKLFKNFEDETLYDYVYYGTYRCDKGVRLKFDSRVEYQIYCTLPDHFARFYYRLTVPGAMLYGRQTHALKRGDLQKIRKCFHLKTIEMPGTHLFPFEYPEKTAMAIKTIISEVNGSSYNEIKK